jgi:cob(I)alamin adenosyltransferase
MSIVTKTGDDGTTRLLSGEKVPKYHPLIEICGDLDELVSFLGVCRASIDNSDISKIIYGIQQDIFTISAEVSAGVKKASILKAKISKASVESIENCISSLEGEIKPIREFTVPGENLPSAYLDVSRTMARRVERKIARSVDDGLLVNRLIPIYINRLSDLLYLLARIPEDKIKRK